MLVEITNRYFKTDANHMIVKVTNFFYSVNIVSAYAPQVNNSMEEKNDFWEDLDGLIV